MKDPLNPTLKDIQDWLREDEDGTVRRGDLADKLEAMSLQGLVRGLIEDCGAEEIRYFLDREVGV